MQIKTTENLESEYTPSLLLTFYSSLSTFPLFTFSFSLYTSRMFSKDFTFTKRQLGILMLVVGSIGFVVIIGVDVLNAGREGGIGPAQQIALIESVAMALIGASLIPLGDDPA